jgi:FtsZ-binding cell division protein ZapB
MSELELLEQKVSQLVQLHKQAKEESRDLRQRALRLEADNKQLAEKIAAARARIDLLVARMNDVPEES